MAAINLHVLHDIYMRLQLFSDAHCASTVVDFQGRSVKIINRELPSLLFVHLFPGLFVIQINSAEELPVKQ
jgi:hypothetical protein